MSMFVDMVNLLLTNMFFTGLVLFPLAVFTILRVMSTGLKFLMVHSGFIECNMIRHNNTLDTVLRAPKGRKIIYKGRKFPYSDNPVYILRKGPIPRTYYDVVTGLQLPLKDMSRELINNEITDTAVKTSYDLGYKDGLDRIKKDETLQVLLLIGVLVLLLISIYSLFKVLDSSKIIIDIQNGVKHIGEVVSTIPKSPPVVG